MKLITNNLPLSKPLVWLEIDSAKIKRNLTNLKTLVSPGTGVMAVLKANAYGVGAVPIAKIIESEVESFGVVGTVEALTLRAAGITKPIVNLGIYTTDDATTLIEQKIIPSIFTLADLQNFAKAAKEKNQVPEVWLKIDTGLGRLGIPTEDALNFIEEATQSPNVVVTGIYSALTEDPDFDQVQIEQFKSLKNACETKNLFIPTWSLNSSGGLFTYPDANFDLVRIGIALLGLYPSKEAETTQKISLEPAITFKTKVACVKELEPGESIFYRRTFKDKTKTRVAVLLAGYSYGLDPRLVEGGQVLIRGQKYPFIAGISATNSFVEIGLENQIQAGDEVVLIGQQGNAELPIQIMSELLNQSAYQILSRIPEKVTRLVV